MPSSSTARPAATGSTSSCGAAATQSRPGPRRSCATSSPNACSVSREEGKPSMDFSFTEDQETLRREARAFLAERFPADCVAELADSDDGWDPSSWKELAELGWLGVSIPEDQGGAGLGFVEEAVLHEELGRALYPGPYFATVALALPALSPELRADAVAGKTRWSAALDGRLVPDLARVDRVLVEREGELLAVPAEGELLSTMDTTRPLGRLSDGATGESLGAAADV